MAWNEPGKGSKDPWGGGGSGDGPPDLDEIARKMRERMNGFFGKKGGKGGGSNPFSFGLVAILALAAWIVVRYLYRRSCRTRRGVAPRQIQRGYRAGTALVPARS